MTGQLGVNTSEIYYPLGGMGLGLSYWCMRQRAKKLACASMIGTVAYTSQQLGLLPHFVIPMQMMALQQAGTLIAVESN